MGEFQKMSESESMVMDVVWNAGEDLTSAAIIDILAEQKQWKPSTVWTFLGRLCDKGLLRARRVGKGNYYSPAVSREQYRQQETVHFLNQVHRGSVKSFFAALGGGGGLDRQELQELRDWLEGRDTE